MTMPDLSHLIPPAPASLLPAEAAAYEQRRQFCLRVLGMMQAEHPDTAPHEYVVMLYRGEVAGRWDFDQVQQLLLEHYQQLAAGHRHTLPSDRLYDIRRDYYQQGEGNAVVLLGAVFDAWEAVYQAPIPPVYGPFLAGQEPERVPGKVFTRLDRQELVAQACAQLRIQERKRWQQRRPQVVLPESFGHIVLSGFAKEVLSSYLAREITAHQAKHLLVTHDDELPSLVIH